MSTNKLSMQGNYGYKNSVTNEMINKNVITSSLVAFNLIEIIKNKYENDYTYDINPNSDKDDVKDFMSIVFKKYIYDKFYDNVSSGINDYFYSYYDGTKYTNSFGSYQIPSDKFKGFSLITYKYVNNNNFLIPINILGIDNISSDSGLDMVFDGNMATLYHSTKFGSEKYVGTLNNMNSKGYDTSIKIPYLEYDNYGHITDAKDFTYTSPSFNNCKEIIWSGSINMAQQEYVDISNLSLDNYTMLVFNFTWKDYILNNSIFDSKTMNISYPVYIHCINTGYDNNNIETCFKDGYPNFRYDSDRIEAEQTYNTFRLGVSRIRFSSSYEVLRLQLKYYDTFETHKNTIFTLNSIVGYVIG